MVKNKQLEAMSFLEYTMLIIAVGAALLGMQIYMKRAVSGRWRQAADTFGYGRQYDAPEMRIWGR